MNHRLQTAANAATSAWSAVAFGASRSIAARLMLAVAVLATTACASLPGGVQRPVSTVVADTAGTDLAAIAAASAAAEARGLSGFQLLADGGEALAARLALIRRAQKSLDVQYYQIAHDATGLQFLRELRSAAGRGVRVRVLIDDLYASGQDALLAGLAANANVEVRLFNPLPVRSGGLGSRVALSLHEFTRINGRMHNKLFVADNAFAVSGGRNIADEYFGRSAPANFIDMDVMSSGPVVQQLSAVFDGYWNSEHAYPVQSLVGADFDHAAARGLLDARIVALPASAASAHGSVEAQLAAGHVEQHYAAATVHADLPSKIGASRLDAGDRTVMSNKLDLIRSARSEVLMASPYFIPGERGLAAMREAVANDVRLTVMTNSLATTDEPLVHFGYARYRGAMLKMGVQLHELKADIGGAADRSGKTGELTGSLGRLHAKLAVVDQRFLFIGSMNMDGRSARWNTEIGLVIDSPALAGEVASLLRRDRLPASYRLRIAAGSDAERIEWVAGAAGAGEVVHQVEPHASAGQQLRLWLTANFVSEDLL